MLPSLKSYGTKRRHKRGVHSKTTSSDFALVSFSIIKHKNGIRVLLKRNYSICTCITCFLFVLFLLFTDTRMLSKQNGLCLAFVFLNLILLYHKFTHVYVQLFLLLLVFVSYKYLKRTITENIDVQGKGVLVTGCDTGKLK